MTTNEQHAAFERELNALIERYRNEFDLTLGQVVGTMQVVCIKLTMDQMKAAGGDTYATAKDTLDVKTPKEIMDLAMQMPPQPKPCTYAVCPKCQWPGGTFDTLQLATDAHESHEFLCVGETIEVAPPPAPLAGQVPDDLRELSPMYAKCAGCGWQGGVFKDDTEAAISHNSHRPTCKLPTKLWSLPPETREFIESGEPLPPMPGTLHDLPLEDVPPRPRKTENLEDYFNCEECGWKSPTVAAPTPEACDIEAERLHKAHCPTCPKPVERLPFF